MVGMESRRVLKEDRSRLDVGMPLPAAARNQVLRPSIEENGNSSSQFDVDSIASL